MLAIFSNWLKHTAITSHLRRVKQVIRRNSALHQGPNAGTENQDVDTEKKDLAGEEGPKSEDVPRSPQKLTSNVHFETREVDENGVLVGVVDSPAHLESEESSSETSSGKY